MEKEKRVRTFTVYRRGDLSATHDENQWSGPDKPQFDGAVFPDGTCVLRWCANLHSTSVWNSLEDAFAIHGHPEIRYGTEIIWHDEE